MRTAISFGGAGGAGEDWSDLVEYVREAERLGVDFAWSAEAWGQDAVTAVAYLAAVTSRIRLGTGIMQITARVPPMIAMTALSLDRMTGGRFVLGLGVSGPQVVEGMHGVRFDRPLERLRETLDVVEMALRGERIAYAGKHFTFPLPGGEGKAIALSMSPRPELPIYLATLGPRSLELTGERAQGWLGTSFVPDRADVFFEPLARGAARAGRTLSDLDIQVGGRLHITDDVSETVAKLKPAMAFQLGAMGSATTNFYNDAFRRWRSSSARWALRPQISTTTPSGARGGKRRRGRCSGCGSTAAGKRRQPRCRMTSSFAATSSEPRPWCANVSATIATPG